MSAVYDWATEYARIGSSAGQLFASGVNHALFLLCLALCISEAVHVCMLSCWSCPTPCHPMDCSPQSTSVHGIPQNTGVGCHLLLQGIFLTQGLTLCLLHLLHSQAYSLPVTPPGKPHIKVIPYQTLHHTGGLSIIFHLFSLEFSIFLHRSGDF